jgi:UDP-glucose 4-epimerase
VSRVLVTGASGFIGQALVPALLSRGHAVRAASRGKPAFASPVEAVAHGDLRGGGFGDGSAWLPLVKDVDAVVHLAGIAHTGPGVSAQDYDRVNHCATVGLAAAAATAGVGRLVFVSTIRAQTGPSSGRVLTEDDPPAPTDPYGHSKLAAEVALAQSETPFTVLRPVLVYGRGVKGNLAALARLAALPVPLPFGAFDRRRSLLGIGNLVAAIGFVLGHADTRSATYIVADPEPVSLAQIVTALRAGTGRSPGLVAVPPALMRFGLTAIGGARYWDQLAGELVVDPGKLMRAGFRPQTSTAAGLAAMTAPRQARP